MNMFVASDERVLCWGRALLTLEANVFRAGDEHFSTGDKHIEPTCLSFSHTQTATVYQRLPSRVYVEMIIYSQLLTWEMDAITFRGSRRYPDARQCFW